MKPPPCPQEQDFSVLSGFITPGSDFQGPHPLDASITVDVLDPTEHNERVRIVETADRWAVEVDWCICGPFAAALCGCWCVQVYIDDIDGEGPTHGLLGSARVSVDSQPIVQVDDTSQRCYEYTFEFPAGSVGAGVYNLVVVITLATGSCERPGPLLHDTLGYAEIPVLVFFGENAPFCRRLTGWLPPERRRRRRASRPAIALTYRSLPPRRQAGRRGRERLRRQQGVGMRQAGG